MFTIATAGALCALFMAVTFIQSGLNKVIDFKGNTSYFNSVVEKTFLKGNGAVLLVFITMFELGSGLICGAGAILAVLCDNVFVGTAGLFLSALTLLMLLFGQRLAKDYAGAASLTGYFLITAVGMLSLQLAPPIC